MIGEAWRVGLDKAVEELGNEEAIKKRIEKYKNDAVSQAWANLEGERRVTALFPLPVQFRSLDAELSISVSTEETNLCQKRIPLSIQFAVKKISEGRTWKYYEPADR